jgi:hypothetical protein
MLISDEKLVLATLLKLYMFAEEDGDLLWIDRLRKLFKVDVPAWRLEIVLESMRQVNWVSPELILDRTVWKITPVGYRLVQDCLRQPSTFLSRLKSQGDEWLKGPEASSSKIGTSLKIPIADHPFDSNTLQHSNTATGTPASRWELHRPENRLALTAILVTIAIGLLGAVVAIWLDYN